MTVLIARKLLYNCANYASKREPDDAKEPLAKRFTGESAGFDDEAIGVFMQGVLSRLALGPQILELQLRKLVFDAVPADSEARAFLLSKTAGTADVPVLTVLAVLEKQYTSAHVIEMMTRRVQTFRWRVGACTALHFTRTFIEKVRRVCASRPGYQPADKLGAEFLADLTHQLAQEDGLYLRLCEPDPPLQSAKTVDEVLEIVEELARRDRRQRGMLSLRRDVGNGARGPARGTARVAAVVSTYDDDDTRPLEDQIEDVSFYDLHLSALMLECGKTSDDPQVRVADLTEAEVDTLHSTDELRPIVKGLLRAFCVRDRTRAKRPEWPRHLQLAQRRCIYQPHCSGQHYVLECPVLARHYREGKTRVAQVRGRDGKTSPLDLRQHPHYLRLIAKELNDGVIVEQTAS